MISVYNNEVETKAGPRKIELYASYIDVIKRGREDPCWFIENFIGVKLLDYQKWIINSAWTKKTVCLVCSRNTGKSFIASLYIMTRGLLFPSMKIWIMSATGAQAEDTFTKIEDIAKHNISSVSGGNSIFLNELVRKNSTSDGFIHEKGGHGFELYSGSTVSTLVGKAENVIGKRSNLSVYDEAAIISEEFFTRTEPFTTQSADFLTGDGIDLEIYPKGLPNQNLYLSSAGDTSGHLWAVYRECAMRMAMGFDDCFVADISCEIPLNPTMDGKKYPPLFDRARVDSMMKTNAYRALREYFNIFDQLGGTDLVVTRDAVMRSEEAYLPVYKNENPNAIYGLFFDPAHQADNSFVLIGEFVKTEDRGWIGKIINGVNLVETMPDGQKRPMVATKQLEWIHELMLEYNSGKEDYEGIHLEMDPGAGGGGRIYSDFLLQEWQDKRGKTHHGVIDLEDDTHKAQEKLYPRAIKGVLRLPSPTKYKNVQFESITQMVNQGLIIFPKSLPGNNILTIDNAQYELNQQQLKSLLEIDLLKEELYLMRKTKTDGGNTKFALRADKARTAHDDRAYTMSMFAHFLVRLRHDDTIDYDAGRVDFSKVLNKNEYQKHSMHSAAKRKSNNPFANRSNPFRR